MVDLRCQDCGRIVKVSEDWDTTATCDECSGSFEEKDSENDLYEEDESEESEELDDITCHECGKDKDVIFFKNADCNLCKDCIDEKYPRKEKLVYKEKIIEKPVIKYLDKDKKEVNIFESKSKFD